MTDAIREADAAPTVRVWDPVVRIFHWTLATSFLGAWVFESPRNVHETLGWIAAGAVGVRILWGLIGSRHARFTDFVPGPRWFFGYLADTLRGRERRHLGHNPAGGAMIVALLIMVGVIATTGWMMGLDAYWGKEWVEELHEGAVNLTLGLVALHVGGVVWEGSVPTLGVGGRARSPRRSAARGRA